MQIPPSTQRLTKQTAAAVFAVVEEAMAHEQWYTQANLSLTALAQRLDLRPHDLSYAINAISGLSLPAYLNAWRIAHAKQLLSDANMTALAVAYASGFASKASFYRVFKAHTGMSPSAYRPPR